MIVCDCNDPYNLWMKHCRTHFVLANCLANSNNKACSWFYGKMSFIVNVRWYMGILLIKIKLIYKQLLWLLAFTTN